MARSLSVTLLAALIAASFATLNPNVGKFYKFAASARPPSLSDGPGDMKQILEAADMAVQVQELVAMAPTGDLTKEKAIKKLEYFKGKIVGRLDELKEVVGQESLIDLATAIDGKVSEMKAALMTNYEVLKGVIGKELSAELALKLEELGVTQKLAYYEYMYSQAVSMVRSGSLTTKDALMYIDLLKLVIVVKIDELKEKVQGAGFDFAQQERMTEQNINLNELKASLMGFANLQG